MRVLAIGSDRSVLSSKSASAERQIAYGARLGALDIVVFALKSLRLSTQDLSDNVRAYPTSSWSRLFYGPDALLVAFDLPKPDVVTAQDPFEAGLVAWLIALLRGAPLHVQVHTDISAQNVVRKALARFVLRSAARVRVVSTRIEEQVRSFSPNVPVTVLPIFVDTQRFEHADPGECANRFVRFTTKLLVVGRLEKEKNVELAIEAFVHAAPRDACLIVLGKGGQRAELELQAARLGVKDRVFFEGEQDPLPYYALADLVLMTSRYEGSSRVLTEALAARKPVLSTDVGTAREAGAIVTVSEQFADSLARWFKDGPRIGVLKSRPYTDFDDYVQQYCADIAACARA